MKNIIFLLLFLPAILAAQTQLTNIQADSLANDAQFVKRVKISLQKEATQVLTGSDSVRVYARQYLKPFAGAIVLEPNNQFFLNTFVYAIVSRRKSEPLTDAQLDRFCRRFFDDIGTEYMVAHGMERPVNHLARAILTNPGTLEDVTSPCDTIIPPQPLPSKKKKKQ